MCPPCSGARGCGCGCAGGRRVDAPPGPDRPEYAPAPVQARPARALWPMRITAPASGIKVPWTGCGSRTLPTCGAPKAGSTCVPCVMRTRVECLDTPWVSSKARALVITALGMAATTRGGFPTGVVLHTDRGTQFICSTCGTGILAGACTSVRKAVTPAMQPKLGIVPGSSPVEFTLVGAAAGLVHLL